MTPLTRHRGVALLALIGLFISAYLWLYHLGYYGMLQCGTGSCEVVQSSKYADFLSVSVPAWGTGWYLVMTVLGMMLASGHLETSGPGKLAAIQVDRVEHALGYIFKRGFNGSRGFAAHLEPVLVISRVFSAR